MTVGVNSAYFTVCAWLLAWDSLHGACRQRNEFTLLSVPMPCHVSNITTTLVLILSMQSAIQHAENINMLLTVTSELWGGTASCPGSTTGIFWWAVTSRSSLPSTWLGSCSEYIYAYGAIHIYKYKEMSKDCTRHCACTTCSALMTKGKFPVNYVQMISNLCMYTSNLLL